MWRQVSLCWNWQWFLGYDPKNTGSRSKTRQMGYIILKNCYTTEGKDNPCNGRKCLQMIYLFRCGGGCSVTKSCSALCNPIDCSMPGFPVLHRLPDFAKTHVHGVGDAILLSHPLLPPPPASCPQSFPASGSFPVSCSSHQVARVLELQFEHQSFQWIFKVDFL